MKTECCPGPKSAHRLLINHTAECSSTQPPPRVPTKVSLQMSQAWPTAGTPLGPSDAGNRQQGPGRNHRVTGQPQTSLS